MGLREVAWLGWQCRWEPGPDEGHPASGTGKPERTGCVLKGRGREPVHRCLPGVGLEQATAGGGTQGPPTPKGHRTWESRRGSGWDRGPAGTLPAEEEAWPLGVRRAEAQLGRRRGLAGSVLWVLGPLSSCPRRLHVEDTNQKVLLHCDLK